MATVIKLAPTWALVTTSAPDCIQTSLSLKLKSWSASITPPGGTTTSTRGFNPKCLSIFSGVAVCQFGVVTWHWSISPAFSNCWPSEITFPGPISQKEQSYIAVLLLSLFLFHSIFFLARVYHKALLCHQWYLQYFSITWRIQPQSWQKSTQEMQHPNGKLTNRITWSCNKY